jgi:hypothetical protein
MRAPNLHQALPIWGRRERAPRLRKPNDSEGMKAFLWILLVMRPRVNAPVKTMRTSTQTLRLQIQQQQDHQPRRQTSSCPNKRPLCMREQPIKSKEFLPIPQSQKGHDANQSTKVCYCVVQLRLSSLGPFLRQSSRSCACAALPQVPHLKQRNRSRPRHSPKFCTTASCVLHGQASVRWLQRKIRLLQMPQWQFLHWQVCTAITCLISSFCICIRVASFAST